MSEFELGFVPYSDLDESASQEENYGWLCVKWGLPDFNKPEMIVHWYPIESGSKFKFQRYLESVESVEQDRWPGVYRMGHLQFALKNRGGTIPVKTETIPIEPPKTKVDVRWHNGRWEKLLKSKGWVRA
jgi:hypothetical protein